MSDRPVGGFASVGISRVSCTCWAASRGWGTHNDKFGIEAQVHAELRKHWCVRASLVARHLIDP